MEDLSEFQNGKTNKNIKFSENIGKLTVTRSFENTDSEPNDILNLEFVYYDKKHEIQIVKQPKDFQVNTDVKLFDRKLSSMYDENIEKNRELLIALGVTTNISSLNTKENINGKHKIVLIQNDCTSSLGLHSSFNGLESFS